MEKNIPTEDQEQTTLVKWLDLSRLRFCAIPIRAKDPNHRFYNYRMGVRKGAPDLLLITKKGLLFIEMKRIKGGKVSPEQREWIDALNAIPNVEATVCYGFEEAKNFISQLLN